MPSAAPATEVFHLRATGYSATAIWTSFPGEDSYQPNVVYQNTLAAAVDLVSTGKGKVRFTSLSVDQFAFKFDEQGNFIPVIALNGTSFGRSPSITVERDLSSALAVGTLDLTICFPTMDSGLPLDQNSLVHCGSASDPRSAGKLDFRLEWTATAEPVDAGFHTVEASPCFLDKEHSGDIVRFAVTSINPVDPDLGEQRFGEIRHTKETHTFVEHNPSAPVPLCPPPAP